MANEQPIKFEIDADLGGCASSEPFALQVTDDSMEPEFRAGCIIIVDPAGVIHDGAYVMAKVNHDEYIFRQLHKPEGGEGMELRALHQGHDPIPLPSLQDIVGVIVQRAGTRRRDHKSYY